MTDPIEASSPRGTLATGKHWAFLTGYNPGHFDIARSLANLPRLLGVAHFSILFIVLLVSGGCVAKSVRSVCYYGVLEELRTNDQGKEVLEKLPPRKAMAWQMEYEPWRDVYARGKDWQDVEGYIDLVDGSNRVHFICRVKFPQPSGYWRSEPEPELLEVRQLFWAPLQGGG